MDPFLPADHLPATELGVNAFTLTPRERAVFYRALQLGSPDNPREYAETAFAWADQNLINARLVYLTLEGRVLPEIKADGALSFRLVTPSALPKVRAALAQTLRHFTSDETAFAPEPDDEST